MTGEPGPVHKLQQPRPIKAADDCSGFRCGKPDLDDWLVHRALKQEGRASRTYVVCSGDKVVGYYCLAAGSVLRDRLPSAKLRKNMPDAIPVIVIGRLAVDERFNGQGIGGGMLKGAILKSIEASRRIGIRAILVHVIDETAPPFYDAYGFVRSPMGERTFVLPINTAVEAL